MAKVEKITQSTDITINPKSKNKVYEYGAEGITVTFDGGFITDKGKSVYGYSDNYFNFAFKNKDNLQLVTLFTTDSGKAKRVTTTIKNYFADDSKNYTFEYKTYYPVNPVTTDIQTLIIKPDTAYGTNGLYSLDVPESADTNYFLGTNSKDNFEFTDSDYNYVYEVKGNDEYLSRHEEKVDVVFDLAGNDSYQIDSYLLNAGSALYAYDYAGKDKYFVSGEKSKLYSKDYAGNDQYQLDVKSDFWVDDYRGNDKYWVRENNSNSDVYNHRINDNKGNDYYNLYKANITVVDEGGKDKYEIKETSTLDLSDNGKGNDTFVIKDCTDLEYNNFIIGNVQGNETYTLDNVAFKYDSYSQALNNNGYAVNDEQGNDKYNIKNSQNLIILDEKGKDNYTITGSTSVDIMEESGNDKYTIIDGNYIHTTDQSGNDKYNISVTENCPEREFIYLKDYAGKDNYTLTGIENRYINRVDIIDFSHSKSSKDKYNISYTSVAYITDYGGSDTYNSKQSRFQIHDYGEYNDTYKIDKLQLTADEYGRMNGDYIWDQGGKDSLTVSGLNRNDIVFMTNYSKDNSKNYYDKWNSLVIYDKTNKGYVQITQFYEDSDENGSYEGYGYGRIETIKAGKTTLKNVPTADYFTDSMREQVGAWLTQNDCSTVIGAIEKEVDISGLIQIFQGG